jgi:hypothetical protein
VDLHIWVQIVEVVIIIMARNNGIVLASSTVSRNKTEKYTDVFPYTNK